MNDRLMWWLDKLVFAYLLRNPRRRRKFLMGVATDPALMRWALDEFEAGRLSVEQFAEVAVRAGH